MILSSPFYASGLENEFLDQLKIIISGGIPGSTISYAEGDKIELV